MNENLRFIWICPLCKTQSIKSARSHSIARKNGVSHLKNQHGDEGRKANIIIKKFKIVPEQNKKTMGGNAEKVYTWICPICSSTSRHSVRCEVTARRYGMMHLSQMHKRHDLSPIIKESSILKKQKLKKKPMKTPSDSNIWFEISKLPAFKIQPIELLRIPNHIFVSQRIYKKIQRQEV